MRLKKSFMFPVTRPKNEVEKYQDYVSKPFIKKVKPPPIDEGLADV